MTEKLRTSHHEAEIEINRLKAEIKRLTGAVDPRWMQVARQGIDIERELRKQLLIIERDTIEMCAQLAINETLGDETCSHVGERIAAAIMARKVVKVVK